MDRNNIYIAAFVEVPRSLSARRAWIEIKVEQWAKDNPIKSLSARRAWIEICDRFNPCARLDVALRKESVDRNFSYSKMRYQNVVSLSARRAWIEIKNAMEINGSHGSRSPQGERG